MKRGVQDRASTLHRASTIGAKADREVPKRGIAREGLHRAFAPKSDRNGKYLDAKTFFSSNSHFFTLFSENASKNGGFLLTELYKKHIILML